MFSKSKNLIRIQKILQNKDFKIPKFFLIKKKDFYNHKKNLRHIKNNLAKKKIIVRSSGFNEDKLKNSNAGKYDSVFIYKFNERKIIKAIELVSKKLKHSKDEIIIQELITKPDISGVIFFSPTKTN